MHSPLFFRALDVRHFLIGKILLKRGKKFTYYVLKMSEGFSSPQRPAFILPDPYKVKH